MSDGLPPTHLSLHYTLKHRAIATVSRWFDGYTYTVRHGLLAGMRRKGGLGFLPQALSGTQATPETRFLANLDLTNAVVYDVGGFQGLLTLFFSARARSVVVYEPNPMSRERLEENLRLNGVRNVTVRPVGAGSAPSRATLVYDPLMPGAASADPSIAGQISETAGQMRTADIEIVRLDDDIRARSLPTPTLVKIDVEGLELAVLAGLAETIRRVKPALYIEMHGATLPEKCANANAVVHVLTDAGYTIHHVESNGPVTPQTSDVAAQGHLYAT